MTRVSPVKSPHELRRVEIHTGYKNKIDAAKKRLADAHKNAQKLLDEAVDEFEMERQAAYAVERRELLELHTQMRKDDAVDRKSTKIRKPSLLHG